MNTYNLKKMCAVSVASIMCVSALAFTGCGDKKAEVSQTPDETTLATTAVSTADEPTAQNYLESIGIDTATLGSIRTLFTIQTLSVFSLICRRTAIQSQLFTPHTVT